MPRKGRKRPDSFTLIVVPHTEKAAQSVRIPFWSIYVAVGLLIIGVVSLSFLLFQYQDTAAQLAELRRGGQVDIIQESNLSAAIAAEKRQQESLRLVIADQQAQALEQANERADEAIRFNEEVGRLYTQVAELEEFKAEIRRIVGLDKVTPVPSPQAGAATPQANSPTSQAGGASTLAIGPLEPLASDRSVSSASSRGSLSEAAAQEAIAAAISLSTVGLPQQSAEMEALKQQVAERVSKVGGGFATPEQLNQQLSLYDASPRNWPVYGIIQARFGYDVRRLDFGAQPFHQGIDISNNLGTPVIAPQAGVVTFAGWNGSYGQVVEIRHTMGWSTLYAHLALSPAVPVHVGDKVTKGQVIGYIGLTGLTTGPHLHYEIHLNGTPLDPARYLGR